VDEDFHKLMKSEAANRGLSIMKYTEQLARDSADLERELKRRGGGFNLRF